MSDEGQGRRELSKLHTHTREKRSQQFARVRHQRLQADVQKLRGSGRKLHSDQRKIGQGAVSVRSSAQQYLRLRGRRTFYRYRGRFHGHGSDHLSRAVADRTVRLYELER